MVESLGDAHFHRENAFDPLRVKSGEHFFRERRDHDRTDHTNFPTFRTKLADGVDSVTGRSAERSDDIFRVVHHVLFADHFLSADFLMFISKSLEMTHIIDVHRLRSEFGAEVVRTILYIQ